MQAPNLEAWKSDLNLWRRLVLVALLVPGLALGVGELKADPGEPATVAIAIVDGLLVIAIVLSWLATFVLLLSAKRAARAAALVAAFGIASGFAALVYLDSGIVDTRAAALAVSATVINALVLLAFLLFANWAGFAGNAAKVLAGIAALILPVAQFWQASTWPSVVEKASLSVEPAVEIAGQTSSSLYVTIRLRLENKGSFRVRVVDSAVDICHWKPDKTPEFETDKLLKLKNCHRWGAISWLSWLDADSTLDGTYSLKVPRSEPQLVVKAYVAFARGDRLQLESKPIILSSAPDVSAPNGECTDPWFYKLMDESRGQAFLQQDKFLGYAERKGKDGGTAYFLLDGRPYRCQNSKQSLTDHYNLTESKRIFHQWLAPTKEVPTLK